MSGSSQSANSPLATIQREFPFTVTRRVERKSIANRHSYNQRHAAQYLYKEQDAPLARRNISFHLFEDGQLRIGIAVNGYRTFCA